MPPPVRVQVVLDTAALDALRKALSDSPKQFYATVNQRILPAAQKALDATLNKPGEPTGGHYQFSTLKSQRYYFATHKAPYQRTGNVLQWRIILKAFTGQTVEMVFENPVDYAKYVFGSPVQAQVIGHRGRYLNAEKELPAQVAVVLNNLSGAWVEILEVEAKAS